MTNSILEKGFKSSHRKTYFFYKTTFTFLLTVFISPLFGSIIFVDVDATGANNGQSWTNAYTDLQIALTNASPGDDIWVAKGIYLPTTGTERHLSFNLVSGVGVYGGFDGTETQLTQRDFVNNISRLSGDIGIENSAGDNSYHVVKGNNTDETALIDGFTISNGYANGTFAADKKGGGVIIDGGDAVVINCILENNYAIDGGGMFLSKSLDIPFAIENCKFLNNTGGGLSVEQGIFTLHSCVFLNNTVRGLRVETQASISLIENSIFNNNPNGAIWLGEDTLTLKNCSFSDNLGPSAFHLAKGQIDLVEDCDFSNNTIGLHVGSTGRVLSVFNCTFKHNTSAGLNVNTYVGTVDSCVFTENSGAGFIFTHGNAIVKNSSFFKNSHSFHGGAISSSDTLSVINCTLDSNKVVRSNAVGGAIYLYGGNLKQLLNCSFTGNSTIGTTNAGNGSGAIHAQMNNSLVQNCTFIGNQGTGPGARGGGVTLFGSNTVFKACRFEDNIVSGSSGSGLSGAGLSITGNNTIVDQCIFINNSISNGPGTGGGITIASGVGTQIVESVFLGNSASVGAGVGFTHANGDITINNCIFSGNNAGNGSGGGCYVQNATITNCTFANNVGGPNVAGLSIFGNQANTSVKNCIFKDNSSSSPLGIVSYTLIDWDYTGNGTNVFNLNPKLEDPAGDDDIPGTIDDDLRLQATSPAINTGTTENVPLVDLTDFPRDSLPDIGAYEFPTSNTLPPTSCPNSLNFSTNITPALCSSCANGAIDLSLSGGLSPYSYSWSNGATTEDIDGLNPGVYTITVTDADACTSSTSFTVTTDGSSPSSTVTFPDTVYACLQDTFQLCISVDSIYNSTGFEFDLFYDSLEVYPTGVISIGSNYTGIPILSSSVSDLDETIRVVVYLADSVNLSGSGELICIEFVSQPTTTGQATFTLPFIGLSYPSGGGSPTFVELPGDTRTITFLQGSPIFESQLVHWSNNVAIAYDATHPDSFAITNIYGSNDNCTTLNTPVQPNLGGNFVHQMIDGNNLYIERDIPNTASVTNMISSQDAFLAANANVNNILPATVFEAIAMDADQNGRVSAGDATLILRRSVGNEVEFLRADGATPRDWLFIDSTRAYGHPSYLNYSLTNIPLIPSCLPLNTTGSGLCPLVQPENHFIGIPIGDVDGSWVNIASDGILRKSIADWITSDASKSIVFDFENMEWEPIELLGFDHRIAIPIIINSDEKINSMDLQLAFNSKAMGFVEVENLFEGGNNPIIFDSNVNDHNNGPIDQILSIGAFRLNEGMPIGKTAFLLSFHINCDLFEFGKDIQINLSQLNGVPVEGILMEGSCMISGLPLLPDSGFSVHPNPSRGHYSVTLVQAQQLRIELWDVLGRSLYQATLRNTIDGQIEQLDFSSLARGTYWLKLNSDRHSASIKLIKQ